jgi:hypothetical protein
MVVLDSAKLHALATELAPRWEGIRTTDQILAIMNTEKYQHLQEKAVNVYGLSELEAWQKALTVNLAHSR